MKQLIFISLLFLIGCTTISQTNNNQTENVTTQKIIFQYSPVNMEKTAVVIPFGLMIGGHVTPVDHQYFQNFTNTEQNIEVYSPGNGIITSIQQMEGAPGTDYRVEIKHTDKISSIFIHIYLLSDKIMQYAPQTGYKNVNIPVNAGETIGYYTQNVDYNIVDLDYTRTGLLIPEHYIGEPWKVHVPDTLDYFTDEIKNEIIAKSLRTTEPISGKFDYDIDGRLIGNWFEQGTNGYQGVNQSNYWITHLSISPDYLDNNHIIVSLGDYNGEAKQFGVKGDEPNPANVSVQTGTIKYELVDYTYYLTNGSYWDRISLTKDPIAVNYNETIGTILLQLITNRTLKVEIFPNKTANEVTNFTQNSKTYER